MKPQNAQEQLTRAREAIANAMPCASAHCRHYALAHGKPCEVEAARMMDAALAANRLPVYVTQRNG